VSASPSVSASTSAPASSSTPPSSTSPSPTPTTPPPSRPLRGAFYYPWYPHAWTQNGIYPYTHYHPTAGFYDSTDPALIAAEVAGMRYAGLDFAISSWWGQGSREDAVVPAELAAARDGFKWSLYYEPEGTGNPTVTQLQSDLDYIASRYAGNPGFLTVGGKPVLFVYNSGDSCPMASRWAQANAGRFYVVLKVFSGYRTCTDQPASWHQYGPASATDSQAGYSYTVSPGFWKADESAARLARSETRWLSNIKSMVASGAPWQLVTTWNEWGEGTAVEDATQWAQPGSYGAYIEDLHDILAPKLGVTHRPPVTAARALPLSASVCRCSFVATGGNAGLPTGN
jgi:Glycosyl hydrolase family 99